MRHYVLLTLKPGTDREKALSRVSETYQALEGALDFLHDPRVYACCVERDSNADIMAVIDLDSPDQLQAYLTHPLHMAMARDMKDDLAGRTSFDHE